MSLLDRSPGAAITLANVVLYSVVGVEVWMLSSGSIPFLVATLALIASTAGLLVRWMMDLMGPEEHDLDLELPSAVEARVPQPAMAAPLGRAAALPS